MRWSKTERSWVRFPWPQVITRIRAMYSQVIDCKETLVEQKEEDGNWADYSHPEDYRDRDVRAFKTKLKKHKEAYGMLDLHENSCNGCRWCKHGQ